MNAEHSVLYNFMIFGIKPSTMWSNIPLQFIGNLLTKKLTNYKPEVLFSYPNIEKSPKAILKVIFNVLY